ncbi:hypothetical protein, partial [Actinomadura sp. 7K534]|uniref:hypothetical protein n=1 Tax=Actinomadura sp. 7K534 TaxID=2530366 RepID=UPI001A9FFDF8
MPAHREVHMRNRAFGGSPHLPNTLATAVVLPAGGGSACRSGRRCRGVIRVGDRAYGGLLLPGVLVAALVLSGLRVRVG